jgi:ATP:cob(I)alamin adenosyltransferase
VVSDEQVRAFLGFVLQRLMNVASFIATPPYAITAKTPCVGEGDTKLLEHAIDSFATEARGFVLPGGCEEAARLHVARAVVRRAERRVLALEDRPVNMEPLRFLNRLSDLLYVLARHANATSGTAEEAWDPSAVRPGR